jgi:hypothetical protein
MTYLVPVVHAAGNQDVRPLDRAVPCVRAIRAVHRRWPPRVLLAIDEGKAIPCNGGAAVLVHGHHIGLSRDAINLTRREGLGEGSVSVRVAIVKQDTRFRHAYLRAELGDVLYRVIPGDDPRD